MADVFRKFASVTYPEKYGYAFDSDSWQSGSTCPVESKFRMFETYGDGLTQHSGDWAVTYEHLGDYLISLAVYMLAHKEDEALYDRIGYIVLNGPRPKLIEFAASLIWTEKDEPYGKTRYYSLTEQKITRNQEKRHDKRYREIDKYLNGTAKSIYSVLLADKEYADGMERLCYAFAIKQFIDDQPDGWMDHPTTLLGWWNEDPKAHDKRVALSYGFRAVQSLARSHQEMKSAECEIGNYERNHLACHGTASGEGSGISRTGKPMRCIRCDGIGWLRLQVTVPAHVYGETQTATAAKVCPVCRGSGNVKLVYNGKPD